MKPVKFSSIFQRSSLATVTAPMTPDRWEQINRIYDAALDVAEEERQAFLERNCQDQELRREVESLLAYDKQARAQPLLDRPALQVTAEKLASERPSLVGRKLGPYQIQVLLGSGGMGEVYEARDTRLNRTVAIKVLPRYLSERADLRQRFEREARAIAGLNHPNICALHDVGPEDGIDFLVMEYLEGETLASKTNGRPLEAAEILDIALQVADALNEAHGRGVTHRDIKPANIMLTPRGQVKVLDFGLAKIARPEGEAASSDFRTITSTEMGVVMGTVQYMSPEQALGKAIDHRTDIFSFGIVLYEMATGQLPFVGVSASETRDRILHGQPEAIARFNYNVPTELERIVGKCLEKDREQRYQSAGDLLIDLKNLRCDIYPEVAAGALKRFSFSRVSRRVVAASVAFTRVVKTAIRRKPFAVAASLAVVLAVGAFFLVSRSQRERQRAAADVTRLTRNREFASAFLRAQSAGNVITEEQWAAMSSVVSVETMPPGAEIRWKNYSTPEAAWQSLGRSPLGKVRIPLGALRVEVSKDGFEKFEGVLIRWNNDLHDAAGERNIGHYSDQIRFDLNKPGELPSGMVTVPPGPFGIAAGGFQPLPMAAYLIDKYEVTNRQYKEFVDRGGYQNRAWWKHRFVQDSWELTWEEAMRRLRDATGRPGPATWEGGTYPTGQEQYPVRGVSWYEAAAYAEFAGKSLPSLYHWHKAALVWLAPVILPLSNFGGAGPAPVGQYPGLGRFGTYDMAGNVKEWCWNEAQEGTRYILGGAWNEAGFSFAETHLQPAFDRSANNGFRCVRYPEPLPDHFTAPQTQQTRDYATEKPVPDEVFEIYRSMYLYERSGLDPRVESVDDSPTAWRKEKVTFRAAYGNERMAAYLFLPKSSRPPYQAVAFMPWATAFVALSSANLVCMEWVDFVIKSGRAVIYPVYQATYERQIPEVMSDIAGRDLNVMWVKDLGRSIDYLETRPDIRKDQLGFYGASWGAYFGPFLALEGRIKTAVLADGAFPNNRGRPEADAINFAPRVKIPVLMINGRHDFTEPVDKVQKPMFRWFGTPEKDKRHVLLDTTHYALVARNDVVREVLGWLDKYLGPVQ